jgi:hypothetical protein
MFTAPDEQLPTMDATITPEIFTRVILTLVRRYQITHFEAILELCEHYQRDYESVKSLLTPALKLALLEEVSRRRLLKDNSFLLDKLG